MNLKEYIGMRVRSARLSMGLTQEQLAEAVGKTVETVSNMERGYSLTGLDTLSVVGKSLDVPMVHFFEGLEGRKRVSRSRLDGELEIQRLTEALSDDELRLAIRLVQNIADHRES